MDGAGFCGAPRRALAKTRALRHSQLPVSSAGRGRCSCPRRQAHSSTFLPSQSRRLHDLHDLNDFSSVHDLKDLHDFSSFEKTPQKQQNSQNSAPSKNHSIHSFRAGGKLTRHFDGSGQNREMYIISLYSPDLWGRDLRPHNPLQMPSQTTLMRKTKGSLNG